MAKENPTQTHRSGPLKQANKGHKTGRHRSKGAVRKETNGKTNVKTLSKQKKKELGREARRLQARQNQKKKRDEVIAQKRNFGSAKSAPIMICIIPLQEDLDTHTILSALIHADETAIISSSQCGISHISIPRFKQRFAVVIPPVGNLTATLDAAKVSTTILFASSSINFSGTECSANELLDSWGEEVMVSCMAQGLPTTTVVLTRTDELPPKKRHNCKLTMQDAISKWLPEEKIFLLEKPVDVINVLRTIGSQKQRNVLYRERRPHLLAEQIQFRNNDSSNIGTLLVTGYLQGAPLSVNSLVHIVGMGDFQMSQIDAPEDPHPIEIKKRSQESDVKMDSQLNNTVLAQADPTLQESLISENIPDEMDAEQTWPTEEELALAKALRKKKIVKKVPKGTSEYQAAWIPDEDALSLSECSDDEYEDEMSVDENQSQENSDVEDEEDEEECETMTISEVAPDEQRYDNEIDLMEERQAMEKIKEAKLDAEFPDEIDTPQDQLAKIRFQKYRGLQSFRTSPWDPKENLPIDYARIFQFENFDRTRRRIFKATEENIDGVTPGWYITIHVKDVPKSLYEAACTVEHRPIILFGLLPNEHKMSVLNVLLKHANPDEEPIKSKEKLVFQCGFRRFAASPVFSQHTNGSKHKYERFFQPQSTVIATMFAPIMFPPCPVLCYKEKRDGSMSLVATGSLLSVNPDRMVIKRVVLSGHPFKVNKKSAVIRFMFFNREDIYWFKPVELRTKYGKRGHIKEPLGTHGHMKCIFNNQLKSQDTVLMNLYKRVFPKWTYEPCLFTDSPQEESMNTE